ncbi:MAG: tetratricopeptide repeat protein [Vicinamibacterales bacterium]
MKHALALTALLAIAAVIGAIAYRSAVRERSYRLLIASGEAALAASDTLAAIEDFSGAIAVRPDAMLPRLRRGETHKRRGDLEVAARDFRAAAALDPTATRPLEELGDVLYAEDRFERAADTYTARLALDDRSAVVRYKLALAQYRSGNPDQARTEAERALELDDQLADARYLMGLCLRDLGDVDAALEALSQAVRRAPGLIAAREELAELYEARGRLPEALEQLQVLAAIDRRPERHAAIALAQARAGQTDLAVLTLLSGIRTSDDPTIFQAAIGRVWLDAAESAGAPADALTNALEALERASSAPSAGGDVKALYGRALLRAGQFEAAEQVLQQAVERFPLDPTALLDFASVAERLRHLDLVERALLSYVALRPDAAEDAALARRLGLSALAAHDADTAASWLARASTAEPNDVDLAAGLAEAQLMLERLDDARDTVTRALTVAPDDRRLRSLAARVRAGSTSGSADRGDRGDRRREN